MSSLLKPLSLGGIVVAATALSAPSFAQSTLRVERVTAPVKDAGIYNPDTGTWTRNVDLQSALGTKVLFNNNAPSGYYNPQDPNQTQYGEGRVPSTDSEGNSDDYTVDCFQIAYCTDEFLSVGVCAAWYDFYDSCTAPAGTQLGAYAGSVSSLPGTPVIGTQACWIVTIDNDNFNLTGDNDAVFDNIVGTEELDDFGWEVEIKGLTAASALTGLLISGDPNNAPFGAGTDPLWGFAPGPDGTGLHELDQFFIEDDTNDSLDGCYWFGGYQNNSIWGAHWHQLVGDKASGAPECLDNNGQLRTAGVYCDSPPTSNGASGITANGLSQSIAANSLVLSADNLPASPPQPGIFIAGPGKAAIPFFNGLLCVSPAGLQRLKPVLLPDAQRTVTLAVDLTSSAQTPTGGCAPLNVAAGMQYNFQYWTRDPAAGGGNANFSQAIALCFTP